MCGHSLPADLGCLPQEDLRENHALPSSFLKGREPRRPLLRIQMVSSELSKFASLLSSSLSSLFSQCGILYPTSNRLTLIESNLGHGKP